MRKLYFLLLLTAGFSFSSRSQYVSIPDVNFKNQLMQNYASCFNASGQMDTTCTAIVSATSLNIYSGAITDWDGLQYFDNLQQLYIGGNAAVPAISRIPYSLRTLDIENASTTIVFPALPDWITNLTISNCSILTSITAWPSSLQSLSCNENRLLTSLPALPASLITLNCSGNNLQNLPALPAGLQSLNCSFNDSISVLPALPATLTSLDCQVCRITSLGTTLPPLLTFIDFNYNEVDYLPPLPTGLVTLYGVRNHLTALPAFPNSLRTIYVVDNQITSIPTLPSGLTYLGTSYNPIGVLPALPSGITYLECQSNQLTSLPALPSALETFHCEYNLLTTLPALPANALTRIWCRGNQLTSIPSLPNTLTDLDCSANQLTSLPVLPPNLQSLHCDHNLITFLPEFPQSLDELWCNSNLIRCLPVLPQNFISIDMDNRIGCMPNQPGNYVFSVYDTATSSTQYYSFGVGQQHFPLCSATTNVYHCSAFPLMAGYVYNDNNNNNIKDANEPYRANVRVSLSNGYFTTTDNNGFYQIAADSIGAYTLTCTPPNYFAAVPPVYNYTFNSYDTLIVSDFALQATATVDSVSISIVPQRPWARLGLPMPYDISYENAGTTTLTPVIVFNYPNIQLIYDSSSNAAVVNNGTNLLLNESTMVSGERKTFTAYFHVNINAILNDSIHVNANISANAVTGTDSIASQIRGPYDPNDKYATPALTPEQVIAGKYINYNVRFQNTGNDTAFNVVITDTLSSFLQPSTLQMMNSSHPCKATVMGNTVSFEFLDIQLPDSNVNELKSHGYVNFRIKPQSNVVLNTNIPNFAAIYFDYNLPVITNIAVTQITNLSTVPVKLLSFAVEVGSKNTANVYWTTFNEYNLQNFIIEYSIDGRNYAATGSELPKGNQYNSYIKEVPVPAAKIVYYRLKITDIDGRFYYGPVATLKMNTESTGFSFLNNPVKNVLTISIQDATLMNTTARIINSQGSVVQKIWLKNETETVNINNLATGTYILETVNGSSSFIIIK